SWERLVTLAGGSRAALHACVFKPDGRQIVLKSWDSTKHGWVLKVWDVQSGAELRTLAGHINVVEACAFSPDGRWLIVGDGDGMLRMWDAESWTEIRPLVGHTASVTDCVFSPDGRWVISVSKDRTVKV